MYSDNHLINKAKEGDIRAFEELIRRYDRHVINIAYSYRNSKDDAKDIYQEVFLRVFKGIKNFEFRSEFSTWLYRITANVCITFKRKEKRSKMESLDKNYFESENEPLKDRLEGEEKSDDLVINNELKSKINEVINILPERQRMAFTLKYYEGLKIKEIAEMMNCQEGTIKRYLFNATNLMREKLQPLYG